MATRMQILLFLISAIAMSLASVAFQIGLATGHFKSFEWAMVPLFIISLALWLIWLILALVHHSRQKKKEQESPPPPQSQHYEQRVEASPQQIVNIGRDLLQAAPAPQRDESPPPKPKPNISFVEAVTTTAHNDTQHGNTIYESPQGLGDFKVCVVRFRNDAIVGPTVEQPDLRCHIVYKGVSGNEITDSPRGV